MYRIIKGGVNMDSNKLIGKSVLCLYIILLAFIILTIYIVKEEYDYIKAAMHQRNIQIEEMEEMLND